MEITFVPPASEIVLGIAAALIILLDAFLPHGLSRNGILSLAIVGIIVSAALALPFAVINFSLLTFNGAIAVDPFAAYFKLLFLGATLLVLLASTSLLDSIARFRAEFVGLLMLATGALMLLA